MGERYLLIYPDLLCSQRVTQMGTHFSLKVLLEVPLATVIPGCLFRPRTSSGHLFSVATARAFWSRASRGPGGPGILSWPLQPADPMVAPSGWWRPAPGAAAQSRPALHGPLDCSTPGSSWVAAVSAFHSRPFPGSAASWWGRTAAVVLLWTVLGSGRL